MAEVTGRGSWTTRGGTSPNYELTVPAVGEPWVRGSARDDDHEAVWYGVRAIQGALNRRNTPPPAGAAKVLPLQVDGWFGKNTAEAARQFKIANGRPNSNKIGPVTARVLFRPDVDGAAGTVGLEPELLCGVVHKESTHDPGARGFLTMGDVGLCQINTNNSGVSKAQAFDVVFSLVWTAERLVEAGKRYDTLAAPKRIDRATYMIAQHNWPRGADSWLRSGQAPINTVTGKSLADYVHDVQAGCQ